jgi:signal transduction histidine kinase
MIRWPRPTIRLRLTLTYTALFVITGAVLLGAIYLLVQHREKSPSTAVKVICGKAVNEKQVTEVSGILPPPGPGILTLSPAQCPNLVGSAYYRSFSAGLGGSESGAVAGPAKQGPVPAATAAEVRELTAAVSASQSHALDSLKIESAVALALITMVSFGVSWWMAGRVLAPVHRITEAARDLSERTLHARINLQGPDDELKQLADTFDAVLDRLDRAFRSQHRFVANASHELRTPLATERVLIDEGLSDPSASEELRTILEQLRTNSEDTERLIDALLQLARSERGIEQWSPVELSVVVATVLDQSALQASAAGVTVSSALNNAVVIGDRGLLERLAGNLLENAIRHNVIGGTAAISLSRQNKPPVAVLQVENTGPAVDPTSVAGLVEPFRRAGPDRAANDGGVGLGLSIVEAIVRAHHGTMTLTARHEGGLHVRVQLPVAEPPDDAPQRPASDPRERHQTIAARST